MSKTLAAPNSEILEAALLGLQLQREKLDAQITQVRSLLSQKAHRVVGAAVAATTASGRRELSPEARKRIATAQKKRWAAFRKNKK